MAKRVKLKSGLELSPMMAARAYFYEMMRNGLQKPISERDQADLMDLYKRYCEATGEDAVDAVQVIATYNGKFYQLQVSKTEFVLLDRSGRGEVLPLVKVLSAVAVN